MFDFLSATLASVPREIVIPVVIGGIIAAFGFVFLPPTYHWDGKTESKSTR